MKIVVLAGGISTERDVSLSSGTQIYKALKENGHQAILLDVFLGYEGDVDTIFEADTDWIREVAPVGETAPDIAQVKASRKGGRRRFWSRAGTVPPFPVALEALVGE